MGITEKENSLGQMMSDM